jgi:hypothetical protein
MWAEVMSETHKQAKCKKCGRFHVWKKRGKALSAEGGKSRETKSR